MAQQLDLSDGHHDIIVRYLKFAKSQRSQRLKVIDRSFDDVKHARLLEETYTSEEVKQILDDLCTVVRAEVESELINTAHANVVLLRQLCQQAEKWHLQLQADITELEDGSLIEKVGDMEAEGLTTGRVLQASSSRSHKLSPLEDAHGPSALLQKEIARMKTENAMLRSRLKDVESQVSQILNQKSELAEKFNQKKCELMESMKNKVTHSIYDQYN
ncbi:hypothetical protein V5799_009953 [Amblyomma americanum]|uniref:Leucine zipper transcription factor-like protein 1 n=1 Tax=Amblyomma americanum TaxID=6943 RepID=A0AAQ4F9F4_AMBAM